LTLPTTTWFRTSWRMILAPSIFSGRSPAGIPRRLRPINESDGLRSWDDGNGVHASVFRRSGEECVDAGWGAQLGQDLFHDHVG
jgi:hypothetical protein